VWFEGAGFSRMWVRCNAGGPGHGGHVVCGGTRFCSGYTRLIPGNVQSSIMSTWEMLVYTACFPHTHTHTHTHTHPSPTEESRFDTQFHSACLSICHVPSAAFNSHYTNFFLNFATRPSHLHTRAARIATTPGTHTSHCVGNRA
jgi:hypothetical protein